MKKNLLPGILGLCYALFALLACKKAAQDPPVSPTTTSGQSGTQAASASTNTSQAVPYPQTVVIDCENAPNYGDSVLYPQPTGDYIAHPVNATDSGRYYSWPGGLSLDSVSGAIDVNNSTSGVRYNVGFVKSGTADTCLATVIIGGASYMDTVYSIDKGQQTAMPYYNANPNAPSPCPSGQGSGGPVCQYDVNNTLPSQGIEIDSHTGYIDINKSMKKGMFGLLPLNGMIVNASFYYKLQDGSNAALQRMDVQFQYFNSTNDIPGGLLGLQSIKLVDILSNVLVGTQSNPKPPLIIITRYSK